MTFSELDRVDEILESLESPTTQDVYTAMRSYADESVVAGVGRLAIEGGGGGGSQPGVWKTYGIDSSNQPFDGIDIGDGVMLGRWWTPAAVTPAADEDPFLCVVEAQATFGSTTAVTGLATFFPRLVDGSGFNIAPVQQDAVGYAFAHIGGLRAMGMVVLGGNISSASDGQDWSDVVPGTWALSSVLHIVVTFEARFTAD